MQKGYTVLNLENLQLEPSRDLKFYETEFLNDEEFARITEQWPIQVTNNSPDPDYDNWEGKEIENFILSETQLPEHSNPVETKVEAENPVEELSASTIAYLAKLRRLRKHTGDLVNNDEIPALAAYISTFIEPQSYYEAIRSPMKDNWINAMKSEYNSLLKNHTWELVDPPKDRKIIGSKWVFRIKEDKHGNPLRFKARLVAQGFSQIPGFDFTETYAPVVKFSSLRILLKLAVEYSLHLHQMDVKTAFLHGTLEEEIYMKQPKGFRSKHPDKVCLLKKSLYDL